MTDQGEAGQYKKKRGNAVSQHFPPFFLNKLFLFLGSEIITFSEFQPDCLWQVGNQG